MSDALVEVRNLSKHFPHGRRPAVDDVSFSIARGKTLGLVGESGSGKTTTGRCILRLIEPTSGAIRIGDVDVSSTDSAGLRRLRRKAQMVFQDPGESLTPWMNVSDLIAEPLAIHGIAAGADATSRIHELLDEVGLRAATCALLPEELSGGQRQRVAIARALAVEPEFLVCDEAVSALDVSVQAQVLNLLLDLQRRRGLTYLFIAHNLAVVERIVTDVAVMKDGRVVEIGPVDRVFGRPEHPYTRELVGVSKG